MNSDSFRYQEVAGWQMNLTLEQQHKTKENRFTSLGQFLGHQTAIPLSLRAMCIRDATGHSGGDLVQNTQQDPLDNKSRP